MTSIATSFKRKLIDVFLFVLLFFTLFYFIYKGGGSLGYNWQWQQVLPFFYIIDEEGLYPGIFYDGLIITLKIAFFSFWLSTLMGLIVMFLSQSKSIVSNGINVIYVELIRNTPLLVQIYLVYFVIGPILEWDRMTCGIIALSIFESAYIAEIFRSGIKSVDKGQWESAYALGLSKLYVYIFVILPQALRIILPPMTNVFINLIKHSSIVSVIAIADLTTEARNAVSDTFLSFEIWFSVAIIYLVVTLTVAAIMGLVESAIKIKEH